jgi:hypothetical protein
MKKVLCTLPNASALINGVAFEESDAGMLSEAFEDYSDKQFEGIPGYELIDAGEAKKEPVKGTKKDAGA